jgi:GntR family transcriptional regulator/MocR family aminotransferase
MVREGATSQSEDSKAGDAARVVSFVRLADDDSGQPLHERLYRRIRTLIVSGAIAHGTKMAPSRLLAEALGISRNSVLNALDRLIADGWLEARRGSGVYVAYDGARLTEGTAIRPVSRREQAVAFETGVPPLDLFPIETWNKLQSRRWRNMSQAGLLEGESSGLPELREAIAAHAAATRGIDCSPDQVIVTSGIPAGIDLAARALGLAGVRAWIEDPCYSGLRRVLDTCAVDLVPVPVDDEGIDVAAGLRLGPDARLALVTPACQFPMCVPLSKARREALLAWADANGAWIFEDDFDWSATGARSCRPLAAQGRGNVIYFNSFNHTLFPALRIAYMILPPALIERFVARRKSIDSHPNVPNQMVLADFLNGGHFDDHLRRCREGREERRCVLLTALEEKLFAVLAPLERSCGGHLICALHALDEESVVARAGAAGIAVMPMRRLTMRGGGPPRVLLGYAGFPPEAIRLAVDALAGALC